MGKRRQVANADLWRQVDEMLGSHPSGGICFTKVKGHAKSQDVEEGLVTSFDLAGNAAADALAVAGACRWGPDSGRRRQAWWCTSTAIAVQRMMVDILCSRSARWRQDGGQRPGDSSGSSSESTACLDADSDRDHGSRCSDASSATDDVAECIALSDSSEFEMQPD